MYRAKAYAAPAGRSPLAATTIERRDLKETDVQIEILFCGICHSDVHQARNEWSGVMPTVYPCVPGHEIVGRVTKVGKRVKKFRPGDIAGVGCMVDSCGQCRNCKRGLEQFCEHQPVWTYNSVEKDGKTLYCKREKVLGSTIPTMQCLTESQLRLQVEQMEDLRERMRSNGRCTLGSGCGGN